MKIDLRKFILGLTQIMALYIIMCSIIEKNIFGFGIGALLFFHQLILDYKEEKENRD